MTIEEALAVTQAMAGEKKIVIRVGNGGGFVKDGILHLTPTLDNFEATVQVAGISGYQIEFPVC
jgi:hypothetical protein